MPFRFELRLVQAAALEVVFVLDDPGVGDGGLAAGVRYGVLQQGGAVVGGGVDGAGVVDVVGAGRDRDVELLECARCLFMLCQWLVRLVRRLREGAVHLRLGHQADLVQSHADTGVRHRWNVRCTGGLAEGRPPCIRFLDSRPDEAHARRVIARGSGNRREGDGYGARVDVRPDRSMGG